MAIEFHKKEIKEEFDDIYNGKAPEYAKWDSFKAWFVKEATLMD